jgi:hypothetical protein
MNLFSKILVGAIIVAFAASFYFGSRYGRTLVKCPVTTSDTIYVQDTSWHYLRDSLFNTIDSLNNIKSKVDTLYQPGDTIYGDIDTLAILNKFYSKYGYEWEKKDSNILINGYTIVSKNEILSNEVKYKWLKPQTIINNETNIDNSITYNKYVYGGVGLPVYPFKYKTISNINYINLELVYVYPKGYTRVSWEPYTNSFSLSSGVTIFKIKERK